IYFGHQVYLCPDPAQLLAHLLEARSTFFVGVARVWEKLMSGIQAGIEAEPDETKRGMARGGRAAAQRGCRLQRSGRPVPDEIAAVVAQAQPLFTLLRS